MSLPQYLTIETGRLQLRVLTPETYRQLYENCTDAEIMAFLALREEELAADKLRQTLGRHAWHTSLVNFQLVEKASGTVIGSCGFHTWYTRHNRAEIGYALNDDRYKNQGFMKEALRIVLDYGFEHMALNRVEAFIGPDNEASIRLVTAMGFTREGLLREHYCKDGSIQDSAVYGLLRSEYQGFRQ